MNPMKNKTTLPTIIAAFTLTAVANAAINVISHETFNDTLGAFTTNNGLSATFEDGNITGDRAVRFDGTYGLKQSLSGGAEVQSDNVGFEVILTGSSFDSFNFFSALSNSGQDNDGIGLLQGGAGQWGFIVQSLQQNFTDSTDNNEVRLAFVRDDGVNKFYINNELKGSNSTTPAFAPADFNLYTLGYNPIGTDDATMDGLFDDGQITEARLFTFTNNNFEDSDLLTGVYVPEPSSYALITSLLCLGHVMARRRK